MSYRSWFFSHFIWLAAVEYNKLIWSNWKRKIFWVNLLVMMSRRICVERIICIQSSIRKAIYSAHCIFTIKTHSFPYLLHLDIANLKPNQGNGIKHCSYFIMIVWLFFINSFISYRHKSGVGSLFSLRYSARHSFEMNATMIPGDRSIFSF